MLIAQITDSHLLLGDGKLAGRFDTKASFDRLMANLAKQLVQPDIVLFSGDLGEDATLEEYQYVGAALSKLGLTVLAVPGNHDARAPMREALADFVGNTDSGHLCLCDSRFPITIIGLDTLVEGAPHGELCQARLNWLEDALARQRQNDVLIFMHHPPLTTGLRDMDSMGLLEGRERLARLVEAHGKVRGILCGHMHRAIIGSCGGAPVFVSPSSSHQITFDLRDNQPYSFSDEPAQFAMHLIEPGTPMLSHVVPVLYQRP
ncbi:phosphodiesterase [Martelella soudanensis]|uniref:phosphodiesterase n=1 Tax=unclassified Martelella TaxID=2629616 RepID=UPI0015DE4B27|nr:MULTISPECIES: phosphodiesterase [unclassified Martelella]